MRTFGVSLSLFVLLTVSNIFAAAYMRDKYDSHDKERDCPVLGKPEPERPAPGDAHRM